MLSEVTIKLLFVADVAQAELDKFHFLRCDVVNVVLVLLLVLKAPEAVILYYFPEFIDCCSAEVLFEWMQ